MRPRLCCIKQMQPCPFIEESFVAQECPDSWMLTSVEPRDVAELRLQRLFSRCCRLRKKKKKRQPFVFVPHCITRLLIIKSTLESVQRILLPIALNILFYSFVLIHCLVSR